MRFMVLGLVIAMVVAACSGSPGDETLDPRPTPTTVLAPAPLVEATPTPEPQSDPDAPAVDAAPDESPAGAIVLEGDPLAQAPLRHVEGDAVVGDLAPTLESPGVSIPSDRPTLVLTVVGSCADCSEAMINLAPLLDGFDAQAVLMTDRAFEGAIDPRWSVVLDREVAAAYSGRDRPTAVVIGTDGRVLSRIRPFNQTGATYDMADLTFALEIGANQVVGRPDAAYVATPDEGLRDDGVPAFVVGATVGGTVDSVEVATGRRVQLVGADLGDIDEAIVVEQHQLVLVRRCCGNEASMAALDLASGEILFEFEGWEVAVSPDAARVAVVSSTRYVATLGRSGIEIETTLGASNGSNPDVDWLRGGNGVVFLHRGNAEGVVEWVRFDDTMAPVERRAFGTGMASVAIADGPTGFGLAVLQSAFGSEATTLEVFGLDGAPLADPIDVADGATQLRATSDGVIVIVGGDGAVVTTFGEVLVEEGFRSVDW